MKQSFAILALLLTCTALAETHALNGGCTLTGLNRDGSEGKDNEAPDFYELRPGGGRSPITVDIITGARLLAGEGSCEGAYQDKVSPPKENKKDSQYVYDASNGLSNSLAGNRLVGEGNVGAPIVNGQQVNTLNGGIATVPADFKPGQSVDQTIADYMSGKFNTGAAGAHLPAGGGHLPASASLGPTGGGGATGGRGAASASAGGVPGAPVGGMPDLNTGSKMLGTHSDSGGTLVNGGLTRNAQSWDYDNQGECAAAREVRARGGKYSNYQLPPQCGQ